MRLRIVLAVITTLLLNYFSPTLAENSYQLGLKYFKQGRYLKASRCLEKALNSSDAPAEAWYYLGVIYNDEDSPIAALNSFSKFYQLSPKSELAPQALFDMGKTYKSVGRTDYALQTFRHLAYYFPNSDYCSLAIWNLGNLYYRQGDLQMLTTI